MMAAWDTRLERIDRETPNAEAIADAAKWLRQGELVAFPTETVYGLGADGLNPKACQRIFEAKGRPADNPLILHISAVDQVKPLVRALNADHERLMNALWPGPLTLIFERSRIVPDVVTAGGSTVAIRLPGDEIARALITAAGTPIAAPSANLSGRPSPTTAQAVAEDMNGRIPMILDGGACGIGIESTVVDLTAEAPLILRPGFYTLTKLREYLPAIRMDRGLVDTSATPRSPGQKYRHYAPKAEMRVFVGSIEAIDSAVADAMAALRQMHGKAARIGLLLFDENRAPQGDAVLIREGSITALEDMAHRLFSALREFDRLGVTHILAAGVADDSALGQSIMNRMRKSASGNVDMLS